MTLIDKALALLGLGHDVSVWPPDRLSLALQGGGSFGAFTWGVLDRLLEEPGISFDAISGASESLSGGQTETSCPSPSKASALSIRVMSGRILREARASGPPGV